MPVKNTKKHYFFCISSEALVIPMRSVLVLAIEVECKTCLLDLEKEYLIYILKANLLTFFSCHQTGLFLWAL